jgi:hypothetical protein
VGQAGWRSSAELGNERVARAARCWTSQRAWQCL